MNYYNDFKTLNYPYKNVLGNKDISLHVFKYLWKCEDCDTYVDIKETTYVCCDRVGQKFICLQCATNYS